MNAWLKRCVFNLDLNRESVSAGWINPAVLNSSPRAPPLYIFFMSLLVNTPDSDNQLVRSALHE